jgi:hypothetical protein
VTPLLARDHVDMGAERRGRSEQRVRADMERDRFFKPERAREYRGETCLAGDHFLTTPGWSSRTARTLRALGRQRCPHVALGVTFA